MIQVNVTKCTKNKKNTNVMINSRVIRIFLASSITELKEERDKLCEYLAGADIQNMFLHDKVFIQLVRSEDIIFGAEGDNPQKVLDQRLQECDISLFLFKFKAGRRTREEFEVAKALQKIKKHTICVFCKNVKAEERSKELKKLLKRIDKEGPDWDTFENVGDVKASFLRGLLKYEHNLLVNIGERYEESADSTQFWSILEKTEKSGEEWFKKYVFHKAHENQCKENVHMAIKELASQVGSIMEDKSKPIADRIFCTQKVYNKVVLWAVKTDYEQRKYCDLLFNYAQCMYHYGLYNDAERIYLSQIGIAEELYGKESNNTAASYCNIGSVYWRQGNYVKAWHYYQKSLDIREKVLGINHPDTATSYNGVGLVYWKRGDRSNAMKFHNKALEIRKKTRGINHPDTAESYSNIGMVFRSECNYAKALECHFNALDIRKKTLGLEHTDTAESFNNIGAVYHFQHKYKEALQYHIEAMKIDEKIFGPNHPDTAIDYNNISNNYREIGDYENALEYLKKAVAIDEFFLGIDNPDTAIDYFNFGIIYYKKEQYKEALESFERALNIRIEKLMENRQVVQETQEWIKLTKEAVAAKNK